MKMEDSDIKEIIRIIEPILGDMGIELVDVEYLSDRGRWILRITVDAEGGITLNDCVRVTREIEDIIEVKGLFRDECTLEVSSPGLNRPLKKEKDFLRAVGKTVKVRLGQPLQGRRNFKGTLLSFENDLLTLQLERNTAQIPLVLVEKANILYGFE